MSAQRLSEKTIRRINRRTGMAFTRGWAHGTYSYFMYLPTPDGHEHWTVNTFYGELRKTDQPIHYSSCTQENW